MNIYYSATTADNRKISFTNIGNNTLLLQEDFENGTFRKKAIKISESVEFCYQIQKTQIKARDGAKGLYSYLVNCYENRFCEGLADKVLREAMDNVKEFRG